jgi:predicted O-methyltransferase YrrM
MIRHQEKSVICSLDDDPFSQVSAHPEIKALIELVSQAIPLASGIDLSELSSRIPDGPKYNNVWPGEHYKILAAIVSILKPKTIVEIGTGTGLSALSLLKFLPKDGKLITFDTQEWKQVKDTAFIDSDFNDQRLNFSTDNLTDPLMAGVYAGVLAKTDLFFIDAAKDVTTEVALLKNLESIPFEKPPLMIFDDIRLMNMISIWRSLPYPKLDITSFGHWSGTGLVRFVQKSR